MSIAQKDENLMTACGGIIKNPDRFPSAMYKGKNIYFCTQACLKAFEAAPDAFMKGEIEHPQDSD